MLNPKQRKCIELFVLGDRTQKEIAKELNVTENTISNWKKNAEFDAAYTESLKSSMKGIAAKAFNTEVKLLTARSEMVRLMAAKDLLDRAGFKAEDNIHLNVEPVVLVNDLEE